MRSDWHLGIYSDVSCLCWDYAPQYSRPSADICLRLISFGLTDGGTAGLIYGFIVCIVGFSMVYLSISEMASMLVSSTSLSL
jgi:hypothetical protein